MELKPSNPMDAIAEASEQWLKAYLQPWSVLRSVNAYWGEQWKRWLSTIASTPSPWLPALAENRDGQPAMIDFFLPWLPRPGVSSRSRSPVGDEAAVRAMRRAAAPHVGGAASARETVSRDLSEAAASSPKEAAPAKRAAAPKSARAPAARRAGSAPQQGEAVTAATVPKAAKPKADASASRKARGRTSAEPATPSPAPEKSAE